MLHEDVFAGAPPMALFVYILTNRRDGTLYVGVTNNLARRMTEHKGKLAPGFSAQYGLDRLVYVEIYDSILGACDRAVRHWRRVWKVALIEQLNPDWRDLTPDIV
jgi:putative endonuclease